MDCHREAPRRRSDRPPPRSHALIGAATSREEFYVQATRAASGTHLYVITHEDLVDGEDAIDQHRWDRTARTVAAVADPRRALKPGQEVAWLLRDYLTAHPDPQLAAPTSHAGRATAWQTIAWTLKAHEAAGHNPADLLPDPTDVREAADGLTGGPARHEQMHRLANTHAFVQQAARDLRETARRDGPLPWTPAPLPGTTASPVHADYLHRLHDAITDRVNALRADLTARDVWLDNATVVAAHREQHDLTTGRHQVLGPFPTRGVAPAYADSYWAAAAAAVTAARHSANPPRDPDKLNIWGGREHLTDDAVTILHAITTAIWHHLPRQTQNAVAATMLAHLGTLTPRPDHRGPGTQTTTRADTTGQEDPAACEQEHVDVEAAVLHPANVRHLHHALSVHRLLAPAEGVPGAPDRRPNHSPDNSPDNSPATVYPSPDAPTPAPTDRPSTRDPDRLPVAPAALVVPADRSPQPGPAVADGPPPGVEDPRSGQP